VTAITVDVAHIAGRYFSASVASDLTEWPWLH